MLFLKCPSKFPAMSRDKVNKIFPYNNIEENGEETVIFINTKKQCNINVKQKIPE